MSSNTPEPDSANNDQAMLVTWLSTHDAPCPACKYNLRNLTTPRCPECGLHLSLAIAITEPYLRIWIATTVFLSINAGLGIVISILLLPNLFSLHWKDISDEWFYTIVILFYVATVPTTAAILLLRRLFIRLHHDTQTSIMIAIALMTLVGFITVIYAMNH